MTQTIGSYSFTPNSGFSDEQSVDTSSPSKKKIPDDKKTIIIICSLSAKEVMSELREHANDPQVLEILDRISSGAKLGSDERTTLSSGNSSCNF